MQVRLQKAGVAATRYKAQARLGYRRRMKVTKDSRLMEERNAVVNTAAKLMIKSGTETDKVEAYARAQEAYVRR